MKISLLPPLLPLEQKKMHVSKNKILHFLSFQYRISPLLLFDLQVQTRQVRHEILSVNLNAVIIEIKKNIRVSH